VDELERKLDELRVAIGYYRERTVDWDPEWLATEEAGSRAVLARERVDQLLRELGGTVDLTRERKLVLEGDSILREHAAEYWTWCCNDGRQYEREEDNIPTTHWWWYLDRPDLWPPLEEGFTSARPASPKE